MRGLRLHALLLSLLAAAQARMIAPLRRQTALKLLRRLAEDENKDLLSIDIGGTLAKVMLFQPVDAAPEDGQPPVLDLGSIGEDDGFHDPEQLALSVYAPELRGNLVSARAARTHTLARLPRRITARGESSPR